MPQSLSSVLVHLVFSTKNREPFLRSEIEQEFYKYTATVLRTLKSPSLAGNGTADHVHLLFNLSRTISIADLVKEVKIDTSKWIKTKGPNYNGFHWQAGYAALSIGQSSLAAAKRYIANQKAHHKRQSFQDELRALLGRYEIEFDERYVWD
jgi:putative transposase